MAALTNLVILRAWRDGSVHAEIPTASFAGDDGVVRTHAKDPHQWQMKALCGQTYWGKTSGTGYAHPQNVDCEDCRKLLLGQ